MASNPVARARKNQHQLFTAHFPPSVKPDGWYAMSIAERLEANLGLSVDRAHDYLSWPAELCDAHQLAAQKEVVRAHLYAGFKYMLAKQKASDRERVLKELEAKLEPVKHPLEEPRGS